MVDIQRVTAARRPAEPTQNPYGPVPLTINGLETTGRPHRFDSEQANPNTWLNAAGQPLRPTACTTGCPECGQLLQLELPTGPVWCYQVSDCNRHRPAAPPPAPPAAPLSGASPFRNPFLRRSGTLELGAVDAGLVQLLGAGTVAQRLEDRDS